MDNPEISRPVFEHSPPGLTVEQPARDPPPHMPREPPDGFLRVMHAVALAIEPGGGHALQQRLHPRPLIGKTRRHASIWKHILFHQTRGRRGEARVETRPHIAKKRRPQNRNSAVKGKRLVSE